MIPPAMHETWVGKIPLEKGKATHSRHSDLENCRLCSPCGCKELDTTERLSLHFSSHIIWGTTELWFLF